MMLRGINFDESKIAQFCRARGIARLSLFGSILRENFSPESDIDMLVEFRPGVRVSLFDLGGMLMDLSDMLGRPVDLRTPNDLSRYFRDDVVRSARTLYAA